MSAQNVTTWHVDNARTGVQQNETILTPANVNSTLFGKLFSFNVLGDVYAQPLYVNQYLMSDGNLHNVLIVAMEKDLVYAFDADGNNPSQGFLWEASLLRSGETYVSSSDVGAVDISPSLGITGTPVIDPVGGIIYVVARSKTSTSPATFYQRLHALNLADGSEVLNGPTTIAASAPGTGSGGTSVSFDPLRNNQRSALLLAPTPSGPTANSVFVSFASNGDINPYHGWVLAYDAANIATQTGAWVSTPNGMRGSIWMSGGGPSADGEGNVFVGVANGTFDAESGGGDYGESEVHLTLGGAGLGLADSFTPSNQAKLTGSNGLTGDKDMGMAAPLLLPAQTGSIPNLLVTADKSGTIYLINANAMGGYLASPGMDTSVQDFQIPGTQYIHGGFAFFNNTLFVGPDKTPLLAYTFDPDSELFSTTPSSESSATFGTCSKCAISGSTPSISANNGANGVVWALDNSLYNNSPAILHAYDAANLAKELYNSSQAPNKRDTGGVAIKFTTPTIANGHVYVGGRNALTVYGLLAAPTVATPTFSLPSGSYAGTQSVRISDTTPNASIYYTTNGTTPTVNSTPYTTSIQISVTETISAIATASGIHQSAVAQAAYSISGTPPPNQVKVSLSSVANLVGIMPDGKTFTTASLNGAGCDYSANLLGSSVTYSGVQYEIGPANQKDVVKGQQVVSLPAGSYGSLFVLALAVKTNQNTPQLFNVTYSDKSTDQFTQRLSDWSTPQHYSGESIAVTMPYCDNKSGGKTSGSRYLYQYTFPLNSAKTVTSLTLPNNPDVIVVAATLGSTSP